MTEFELLYRSTLDLFMTTEEKECKTKLKDIDRIVIFQTCQ